MKKFSKLRQEMWARRTFNCIKCDKEVTWDKLAFKYQDIYACINCYRNQYDEKETNDSEKQDQSSTENSVASE